MKIVHMAIRHRALDVRIFYRECRTLAEAGHDVSILIPESPTEGEVGGVKFIDPGFTRLTKIADIWKRLGALYQAARKQEADVYHLHEPYLIPVGLRLKALGAKVLYDAHEDSPREAYTRFKGNLLKGFLVSVVLWFWERLAKIFFDGFICATPLITSKYPENRAVNVNNYPMLDEYNFSDGVSVKPYSSRAFRLMYTGGITEERSIIEILSAMESLPDSMNIKLILAGEISGAGLKERLNEMPGWKKAEFLGWKQRGDVLALLSTGRAGLVLYKPTRDHLDALPNKLFEFMASGLPVVVSNFSFWREIVEGEGCGVVADPENPRSIADAVESLLNNPAEAEAMGVRGREAVKKKYNWAMETKKLLDVYKKLEPR